MLILKIKSVRWSPTPPPLAYSLYACINVDNYGRPLTIPNVGVVPSRFFAVAVGVRDSFCLELGHGHAHAFGSGLAIGIALPALATVSCGQP